MEPLRISAKNLNSAERRIARAYVEGTVEMLEFIALEGWLVSMVRCTRGDLHIVWQHNTSVVDVDYRATPREFDNLRQTVDA